MWKDGIFHGLGQERRVIGKLDRRRAAMRVKFDRTVSRQAVLDEFAHYAGLEQASIQQCLQILRPAALAS